MAGLRRLVVAVAVAVSPVMVLAMVLAMSPAFAEVALPTAGVLAERAGKRFPQPVRVADLVGRDVLQPEESQPVLGRVQWLARRADGGVDIVIRTGATLGVGGRPVAVPIEAVALLGEHVALLDYSPAQLAALPTALPGAVIPGSETIKVGLVKPFH
jgi:hypothetical protein